jgi:hypothetical protein
MYLPFRSRSSVHHAARDLVTTHCNGDARGSRHPEIRRPEARAPPVTAAPARDEAERRRAEIARTRWQRGVRQGAAIAYRAAVERIAGFGPNARAMARAEPQGERLIQCPPSSFVAP